MLRVLRVKGSAISFEHTCLEVLGVWPWAEAYGHWQKRIGLGHAVRKRTRVPCQSWLVLGGLNRSTPLLDVGQENNTRVGKEPPPLPTCMKADAAYTPTLARLDRPSFQRSYVRLMRNASSRDIANDVLRKVSLRMECRSQSSARS